jgi:hypothetical protein
LYLFQPNANIFMSVMLQWLIRTNKISIHKSETPMNHTHLRLQNKNIGNVQATDGRNLLASVKAQRTFRGLCLERTIPK